MQDKTKQEGTELHLSTQIENVEQEIKQKELEKLILVKNALESEDPGTLLKANDALKDIIPKMEEDKKSLLVDPYDFYTSLGYKHKIQAVSYEILEKMSHVSVISSIIRTRINQVSAFSSPQKDEYSTGFKIQKKKKSNEELSTRDLKVIEYITNFIERTGIENIWGGDDFNTFIKKITRDSLIYDQLTFEIVRNKKGDVIRFLATDASTYRLAETLDDEEINRIRGSVKERVYTNIFNEQIRLSKKNNYYPSYVQVYNDIPVAEFFPWELCFGIRNAESSINKRGYGTSELEDLIRTITAILQSDEYNYRFFCLPGKNIILTKEFGYCFIKEVAGKEFSVWDGTDFQKAKGFPTREAKICKTRLWNGMEIKSSPDHSFLVIPANASTMQWKKQKELIVGDYVLIGDGPVIENLTLDLSYYLKGMICSIGRIDKDIVSLILKREEDKEKRDSILSLLEEMGLPKTVEEEEDKIIIHINDKELLKSLENDGYQINRKRISEIPDTLLTGTDDETYSFLKGLFSTGKSFYLHKWKDNEFHIPYKYHSSLGFIKIIQLLLKRLNIASNIQGTQEENSRYHQLYIQDIESFGEVLKIEGMSFSRSEKARTRWNRVHPKVGLEICNSFYKTDKYKLLETREAALVRAVVEEKMQVSQEKLVNILNLIDLPIPEILKYNHLEITQLEQTDEIVPMYDLEVFNDKHAFLSNFAVVHNSQGSSPKGILRVKGDIPNDRIAHFKQQWISMISGVMNSHKTPIMKADEADWIDLQKSNRDMEFSKFQEYLIKIATSVFQIDPAEINFPLSGGSDQKTLFESNNEARIKHSRDKGLIPLLLFIQSKINKYLIDFIAPGYEFVFCGMEAKTQKEEQELIQQRVTTYTTVNEERLKRGLEPIEGGDIILNPIFLQGIQFDSMNQQFEQE